MIAYIVTRYCNIYNAPVFAVPEGIGSKYKLRKENEAVM